MRVYLLAPKPLMPIFDQTALSEHLRTRDAIEWLDSRMENKQTHHGQDLYERRLNHAELTAAEVYHALIWFLEAYPHIESVKPMWVPTIDNDDRSIIIRVRLNITSTDPQDKVEREQRSQEAAQNDPLLENYGYDDFPPSIEASGSEAASTLIEVCENVGPEIWNEFQPYTVSDRERAPYTSTSEVEADMREDLSSFLPALQQWLLDRTVAPAKEATRRPQGRL